MIIVYVAISLVLGAFSWSFAEYALHNWYGHRAKGRNRFSREHLKHHTNGQYFAAATEKAIMASIAFALVTPLAIYLVGALCGLSYAGAFAFTYLSYEWLHRRCHTHAPTGKYGSWLRQHHLHHHYTRPNENHGVTSPIWDILFGSITPSSIVRVPERKIFEVPWLVDQDGEVKPEFANNYVIARPHQKRKEESRAPLEQVA